NDEAAVVVLQRAGDDLGRRSGALIRENDHRDRGGDGGRFRRVVLLRAFASLHRGQLLALLEEHVGDVEALAENATRIAAQIDDDAVRILRLKAFYSGRKVFGCVFIKLLKRDVPDVVTERERVRNGRNVNLTPRERTRDRCGNAGSAECDVEFRCGDSKQRVGNLAGGPWLRGDRFDLRDV